MILVRPVAVPEVGRYEDPSDTIRRDWDAVAGDMRTALEDLPL